MFLSILTHPRVEVRNGEPPKYLPGVVVRFAQPPTTGPCLSLPAAPGPCENGRKSLHRAVLSIPRFLFGVKPVIPKPIPRPPAPWGPKPQPQLPVLGLLVPRECSSLSRQLAGSSGVCSSRYKLLLDSQQRELPLAKDEKLVSWEEIIFREETDNIPCTSRVNPLLPPPLLSEVLTLGSQPPVLHHDSLLAFTISMLNLRCWMYPCGSGLGVLVGEREDPALQLHFFSPVRKSGVLCPYWFSLALPQVKTGICWNKERCFACFAHPGWDVLPALNVKVL